MNRTHHNGEAKRPLRLAGWIRYVGALLSVAGLTGVIALIPGADHIANISMVYLMGVIACAVLLGSGPAILASVASFLAFDWFFVEPRHTFTVHDPSEWLALLTFLVTAITTGQLTGMLRDRAEAARRREREAAALAKASWAVASQVETEKALGEVLRQIAEIVPVRTLHLLVDGEGEMHSVAQWGDSPRSPSPAVVRFVRESRKPVLWGGPREHWEKVLADLGDPGAAYLPLLAESRVLGVLHAELPAEYAISPQERRVVESLANHAAVILARERLARAESHAQALEEADRLKTALLSMVSHDFRSPLTGIKASVTSLLEEGSPLDPEVHRDLLSGINRETDRLNRMVGNILALSRLEADAWRPQKEPTDASELLGTALATFSAEENRRVEVWVDPALQEIEVDPVQMVQVLRNLIENALKYSPAGEPVSVSAYGEGTGAVLAVADRGPGLPPGEEARVFEPFYRAPALRESAMPGVGIGLAVCRGLVEAHGGRLLAHNRDGGGAVFEIRLPIGAAS